MSKAYEIFDAAFSKPRDPRSDEYRHGVIDILKCHLGEANEAFGKHQYRLGTGVMRGIDWRVNTLKNRQSKSGNLPKPRSRFIRVVFDG